ncbi:NAD(P)H dehydrogenase (quinone) [Rhizobium aquaticum]|uniref:NAD(P)H dehydrogenase (Quinone) n=1 Tax=Rhizobium aquaticum TaxID=1549636 RepID=A0ABV2J3U5_9HYPH
MILITGGSGQLATLVATEARARGLEIAVGSHRAASLDGKRRHTDFDSPETLDFSDVETLFLISAGYAEDDVVIRRHENAIAAAERAKVKHVVYTSLTGTGDHLGFALAHRWTEQRLKRSGIGFTILRNGLYAELIGALAKPENGVISAPFGHGAISSVARRDLADAAVTILSEPARHSGRTYELSGTESWTINDLARRIGAEYQPLTLSEKRLQLRQLPLLPFQPPMLMSIFSASAAGFLQSATTDLTALISSAPLTSLDVAAKAAVA